MADRNTKIFGSQIKDLTITLDDLATSIQTSLGLADTALQTETDPVFGVSEAASFVTGDKSKLDGIEAGADVTDATNVAAAGALMVGGGTMSGVLVLNADPVNNLEAATKIYVDEAVAAADLTGVVLESDIANNEIPTGLVNGSNTDYVLANTPEVGSVVVLLNGIQQQPGSGKDYLISGTTITFAIAPETGMVVMCNSIKAS